MEPKHSLELYEFFHAKADECDVAIEALLEKQIEGNEREDGEQRPHLERRERKKENKNRPKMDIEKLAFQLTGGVDLAKIDGVSGQTLLTIISEVGANVDKFQSAKQFAAWRRLAPNNKKTGGKVISSHTPKRKNRLSLALQRAANVIGNNLKKGALHQFFMRIKVKKGYMEAIVATARKLAVIIWNMLSKKEQYRPTEDKAYTEKLKVQAIKNIQRKLRKLNISPGDLVFN